MVGAAACGGSEIVVRLPPDDDLADVDVDHDADDLGDAASGDEGGSEQDAGTDSWSTANDSQAEPDDGGPVLDGEPADASPADTPDGSQPGDDAAGDADDASVPPPDVGDGPSCIVAADCPPVACQQVICDALTGECVGTPLTDGLACDDGNACSVFDACTAGVCVGGQAIQCDDDNPCTDDLCHPAQGCAHKSNFATCDDGDLCTDGDACAAGSCVPGAPKCDDGNPCTADSCLLSTGQCFNSGDDSLACDDGSECTLGDACVAGACVPGPGPGCDDDNDCTLDACDDGLCKHIALHGDACDDGDICTAGDTCNLGECAPGPASSCDDLNSCTVDACIPGVGCDHAGTPGEPCDDGDTCTTTDACDDLAVCQGSALLDCEDDNLCTEDDCDAVKGCVHPAAEGSCDDGDACTSDDACAGGTCGGTPVDCDDDDLCTVDSCDPKLGCQVVSVGAACDDDDPCTDDGCDPEAGCVSTDNAAACDDGMVCTAGDACDGGTCAGVALDCDDSDQCTIDACDPEVGCVHELHHGPCDDSDACTEATTCDDGGDCTGGVAVALDDGIDCTLDSCDAAGGVTHQPDDAVCAVGRVCDPASGCVMGDVRIIVTKLALLPAEPGPADDSGQWLTLLNIGYEPVDLRGYRLVNGAGQEAALLAISGSPEEPLLVEAGARLAGLEAPGGLPSAATDGWDFVFGAPADGFYLEPGGDTLSVVDENGDVADLLDFPTATQGPIVGANALPVVPGAATELDATAAGVADQETDNDPAGLWCVWAAGSNAPAGGQLSCSRARLNEISLAGGDGTRFVELHLPAGGPLTGLELRFYDADGAGAGSFILPGGRMPIGAATVVLDGLGGAALPTLTDGSVHLHRFGALVDTYGFGALNAAVDQSDGHPLAEGTAGPAQVEGLSAERVVDGGDSGDNSVDWQQVDAGSQGALNED